MYEPGSTWFDGKLLGIYAISGRLLEEEKSLTVFRVTLAYGYIGYCDSKETCHNRVYFTR